jgi:L-ascorbate metabolism protein UlaG (beta-lactamase superfamily)
MSLKITWLGQAGYVLKTENTSLVIDPYLTNSIAYQGFIRLYDPPVKKGEIKVDYAMATHDHGDHLDIESLRDWIEFKHFYGPGSCVKMMRDNGFGEEKLHTLDRGQSARLGDIQVTAVHAEHTPDSIGIVAEYGGKKIFITGDTVMHPKLFAVGELKPDILCTCINGKFGNMTWQEADMFAHLIKVKTVIPNHYDLFAINTADAKEFAAAFKGSFIRAVILEVGKAVDMAELL